MSTKRFRRVDRRTVEHLLGGAPDRSRGRLDELLADASAPARAGELAGEEAAVTAFRTARLAEAGRRRRWSMHKLTKLVTVKVAAAAIGAMTVGGVAFAAATGNLATPDGPAVPATTDRTTGSVPAASNGKSGDSNGNDKSTPDKDKPGNGNDGANPGPSPSLKGLCQAYSSGNGTDHGKWLENPAFGALITAAGGPDKVPSYCQNLLAQQEKPGQRGQGQEQGQGRNEQKQQEHKPDHPGHPQNPGNGNGNGPQPGKPNGPPPSSRPGN